MTLLIGLLLGGLALFTIMLKRAYQSIPARQLKKRARDGDQIALLLHRAASYGSSLEITFWIAVGLTHSVLFVYVARHTAAWLAALLTTLVIWYGFLWVPKRSASKWGLLVAAKVSPVIARVVSFLHPVLRSVSSFIGKYLPLHFHTGIYDQQDLIELLESQKNLPDNQIPISSLEIAQQAMQFGDKLVRDILIPRRAVKMVAVDDSIGPVLMSELYDSGFSRFPVYGAKADDIVGVLYLRDLVKGKSSGRVEQKMRKEVLYIHEDQTLEDALKAIIKTRQHMFMVVNSFEEYVGILTMEDVLEQVIGKQIVDEFDQYDDMRAVAQKAASLEHEKKDHATST